MDAILFTRFPGKIPPKRPIVCNNRPKGRWFVHTPAQRGAIAGASLLAITMSAVARCLRTRKLLGEIIRFSWNEVYVVLASTSCDSPAKACGSRQPTEIGNQLMPVIRVQSIPDAVSKGTLIELANDYRTSGAMKACLPSQTACAFAISTAAFSQQVHQGTAGDKRSRIEALCAFLKRVLGYSGRPSPSDLQFRLSGESGKPEDRPLKLEWYAPNRYWVILLSSEQLQPVGNPA